MSNILIIKHGSLGDIAQASGAIQDICEHHSTDDIFLLTTNLYIDLFRKNSSLREIISVSYTHLTLPTRDDV